ncbi:MAG: hypothetical protein JRI75_08220 [Deltaproteobacteria bacterium]|nr:hypothetical protein [Deltaproteobacteria bacterium]
MTVKINSIEQKKNERLKAKKGVFAVLASDINTLGPIKEIGRDGLDFQYIDSGEPSNPSEAVEIFSTVNDFYLKKLPIKDVVEFKVDASSPYSSLPMRQMSIQFGKMTPIQSKLLDYFLRLYTYDK